MTLIIGTTPHSQWQKLTPLLNQLGWHEQIEDPETWYQNSGAASHPESSRYLLLHTRPELAIAQAMEEGKDPATALNEWRAAAQQLLAFFKHHRPRAVMIETQSAAEQPNSVLGWLAHNHPAFSEVVPAEVALVGAEPAAISANLNLLMASQLVAQDHSLSATLSHLEASTLPLGEAGYYPPDLDIGAIYKEAHKRVQYTEEETLLLSEKLAEKMREEEELLHQLHRVQQEMEVSQLEHSKPANKLDEDELIRQLHLVQEELEVRYLKHKEAEQSNSALQEQIKTLEQSIEQLNAQLVAAKSQKGGIFEQSTERLKQFEAELKKQQAQSKQHLQAKETVEQALARKEQEAQQQQEVGQKAEALCSELKEENGLILKQLFQVQEELEKYYLGLKDKEVQYAKLNKERDKLKADFTDAKSKHKRAVDTLNKQVQQTARREQALKSERAKRKAELTSKKLQVRQLEQKLDLMERSTSWRMTAPLRKIVTLFKKFSRGQRLVSQQIKLVRGSDYFDADWYAQHNPDIAKEGVDLAEHYVKFGGAEGRAPSERFSSKEYLRKNPDVADAGLNPLVHYLQHGQNENRKAPSLVESNSY